MTITLFVKSDSLTAFLTVLTVLKDLPLENNYKFEPTSFLFQVERPSSTGWIRLNIPALEYIKLLYCIRKLS